MKELIEKACQDFNPVFQVPEDDGSRRLLQNKDYWRFLPQSDVSTGKRIATRIDPLEFEG